MRIDIPVRGRPATTTVEAYGAALLQIAGPLARFEAEIAALPRNGSVARLTAGHQLDLGGKLLRPKCVLLAASLGPATGQGNGHRNADEVVHLAVAVELIHNATLLHDDVIDLAEHRRGQPSARAVYGNTASVLAGDWLLIEALRRVQRSGRADLLVRALDTIDEMIAAEALQLENRHRLDVKLTDCLQVIRGKTAALFRWALLAGATAGGLAPEQRSALQRYGMCLGEAFQLVDDVLDVTGDPGTTGKASFADLREGNMTYPLLLALERDASFRQVVERFLGREAEEPLPDRVGRRLRDTLEATGSIDDCRRLARERAREATACLAPIPPGPAHAALVEIARIAVDREQ